MNNKKNIKQNRIKIIRGIVKIRVLKYKLRSADKSIVYQVENEKS